MRTIGRLNENASEPQGSRAAEAELRGYFKASITALGELFERARDGKPLCASALRELAVFIVDKAARFV
jgi:hypothetical protein